MTKRIRLLAALGALAVAGCGGSSGGSSTPPGPPPVCTGCFYVSNQIAGGGQIAGFPVNANGTVLPTLLAATGGVGAPAGLTRDSAGRLYLADVANNAIDIFPPNPNGVVTPAVLAGSATLLSEPIGVAVDASGRIYVANATGSGAGSVTIYPQPAFKGGNVAPVLTFSGTATQLNQPYGIALDPSGNVYVANRATPSIVVFPAAAVSSSQTAPAPARVISGTASGLNGPSGLTVDGAGNIWVADTLGNAIDEFAPTAGQNQPPAVTIAGSATQLSRPTGVAVSGSTVFVTNENVVGAPGYVTVYTSYGNAAPSQTVTSPYTNAILNAPFGMTL